MGKDAESARRQRHGRLYTLSHGDIAISIPVRLLKTQTDRL